MSCAADQIRVVLADQFGSLDWNKNVAQGGRHAVRAGHVYASAFVHGDGHGGEEVQD